MNTRQKLTLGIAAIFMVTLTIVGVTYAYFVTRVSGDITESVDIKTATVGSVEYVPGNGTDDNVKLENVLPGTTLYKTFSVKNTEKDAKANSNYSVFLTSTPTAGKAQFVHATATDACYATTAYNSLGKSVTGDGSATGTATATCFDAAAYNNVYVTLYKLTGDNAATDAEKFADDGKTLPADVTLGTPVFGEAKLAAAAGIVDTAATQDIANNVQIAGNTTDYYVLKVEYRSVEGNQNIENLAALTIKASIK